MWVVFMPSWVGVDLGKFGLMFCDNTAEFIEDDESGGTEMEVEVEVG